METISKLTENNKKPNKAEVLFYVGEYLAVRNNESGFFLCICLTDVKKSTKQFSIRWLNKVESNDHIYNISYHDRIHKACVLTTVELQKVGVNFELMSKERDRVEKILIESLDAEKALVPLQEFANKNPDGMMVAQLCFAEQHQSFQGERVNQQMKLTQAINKQNKKYIEKAIRNDVVKNFSAIGKSIQDIINMSENSAFKTTSLYLLNTSDPTEIEGRVTRLLYSNYSTTNKNNN